MTAPHTIAYQVLHEALVTRFNAASDAQTAEWFTRYLKGVIQYRGLKTDSSRGFLRQSSTRRGLMVYRVKSSLATLGMARPTDGGG